MSENNNTIKQSTEEYPYFDIVYDSKERFCSYWHQINEILQLKPKKALEVGIGNGFVSRYLREKRIDLTTMDVEQRLEPNVSGSVLALPFSEQAFNVIACCEVLEHLSYKNFSKALKELARVSEKHVILSLPDVTTVYRINVELPRMKPIKRLIPHPFPRSAAHHFDGEHYWVIGKTGYPLEKIINDIKNFGFQVIKTYRVFEWYYHRFFVLEKALE